MVPILHKAEPDLGSLADTCLGYLAENPDDLLRFMEFAGYDPASLRRSVGSAQLQRGLIDYFASNESILLALCANAAMTPESFMRVWHQLNPAG
ncbi:hypothetical protein VW29_14155 [Devosia limi DSM 17137]|uniref:DUF3572 domain-containing protein n=1 Tax=Devosia limi DSM 17137 TaxID=1121477 RepID=A0A0F5LNV7_9HYPH|nr:hypothetical protein VW29_14155 [Devosia limi DSM 17137]